MGRFISKDPIRLSGRINAYQYAENPTGWIDLLGLTAGSGGHYSDPAAPWPEGATPNSIYTQPSEELGSMLLRTRLINFKIMLESLILVAQTASAMRASRGCPKHLGKPKGAHDDEVLFERLQWRFGRRGHGDFGRWDTHAGKLCS
ncbi:RHS repeat-associated core domain-containing protein [Burkholderia diffusa]|uniref:RHS repeat-associated core domain-containing protein n=1 Tax=Burkholderia diffusa TaxID=488732 RepID=UPI0012480185|nr:RHS repeat-associated core domain-containing protein [Burkholderia diffusa]KAB0661931.1 hypothetical protein F7R23_04610 [Burkholderia diffusa]MBM2656974.1 hypothetical protein [Burkholderia diffusa]